MARGRDLGACLQPQFATAEERAAAERHHTPEAVMREIAVLDFLHGSVTFSRSQRMLFSRVHPLPP